MLKHRAIGAIVFLLECITGAASADSPSPTHTVPIAVGRDELVASLNGGFVYYLAEKWAVSDAVMQRKLADGSEKEIIDGNGVAVIRQGRYSGYLVVERHRYRQDGPAYDCLYVVRPDGKETFAISDPKASDDAVKELISAWPTRDAAACGGDARVSAAVGWPSVPTASKS